MTSDLFVGARACLAETDPARKVRRVRALAAAWKAGGLHADMASELTDLHEAGRPPVPELVPPRLLPKRGLGTREGQAAMLHAIAHIEFNAINLACDAVFRFRDLPTAFYVDWLQVAVEEAHHFSLLEQRLAELGYRYGDFAAHSGLWDLAVKTRDDPLVRMALVPRVMEARGLDVTPEIQRKFAAIGDKRSVEILEIILRDEVGHVAAGSHWFRFLCGQRGLEPEATYFGLLDQYFAAGVRCPLHREARRDAGFSEAELDRLEALCRGT